MSPPTVETPGTTISRLAEELLSCTETQLEAWLQQHSAFLSLQLIQHLKDSYVTAEQIQENPKLAERATRYGLLVAAYLPQNVEMLALAQWARGLWAMYNDPAQSIPLFQAAHSFYQKRNDRLSQVRLLSNLVGVLAECGDNVAAEAYYQAARHLLIAEGTDDPKYLLYLELNFGWLLHSWGRFDEALVVHDHALVLATKHQLTVGATEIRVNRHLTLGRLGRFAESESGLRQERLLAAEQQQQLTVARIDLNLGELYTVLGRPADALRRFQQATQGFAATDNPMEQSVVLALQATLLRQLGVWQVALTHYQTALTLLEQHALKTIAGETLVNLAACLRLAGGGKQLRRAASLLLQADEFWQKAGNVYWLTRVYLEQIRLAIAQSNAEKAVQLLKNPPPFADNPYLQAEFKLLSADLLRRIAIDPQQEAQVRQAYEAVIEFATHQGIHELRRQALSGLGSFDLQRNWHQAQRLLEAAVATDERIRQSLSLQELKASFHEQANDLFDDLIRGAIQQQDYALVLCYSWQAKAGAFLDLATSVRAELTYTVEQRQAIEQVRREIATLRWTLATTAERNLLDAQYEAASPELKRLEEQLLALRRQIDQQQAPSVTISAERVATVLQQMGSTMLLEYVRCGSELYGIWATAAGVRAMVRLTDSDTVAELVGQLALSFHSFNALSTQNRDLVVAARVAESQRLLKRCYDLLVTPFQPYLQAGQGASLLIAPCDALALLPFAAFWTGRSYWIEEQSIELIQSGALLALTPVQSNTYSRAVVVAAAAGQATAVRQEAMLLAETLPDSVLFIDAPALVYLTGLPAPPRLLHIAAHTLQRGDAPFFTAIQLSGEVLSVEQSYDLPLWGTELVTLSGCTTADGMASEAALFAFQSAFLIAGAQRVLCTLWPIADGMAGPIMHTFYTFLQTGIRPPDALRQTQLTLLQHPTTYRHPALWAAFTCIRR